MIVNYKEAGWEIITQRAHGLLAAQLAFNWRKKDRPARWVETILAIAEHDDAENELDGENLLTEAGGPLNFAMKNFNLSHCRKLFELTITKSRYIALLVSLHTEFLYGREKSENAEAKAFLNEQKRLQLQWLKDLDISREEASRVYELVEWCDALSLLICKGELQPEERKVEISTGPDKKMYMLSQANATTLCIDPWPFETNSFDVQYETRLIRQMSFKSSREFRECLLKADVVEKRWTLAKRKPR